MNDSSTALPSGSFEVHPPSTTSLPQPLLYGLYVAAAILLVAFGTRTVASWKNYADLDHNSVGTAVTLAIDARDGILYRPIVSDLGYGGTRYAPLSPVLHATLMRLGLAPVSAGYAISLAATALVLSGLFALMRCLAVPTKIAAPLTLLVLTTSCFRTTVLEIKPDLLPLGLSLWGLVAVVAAASKPQRAHPALFAAAICFALGMSGKFSSIFGIATATLWLLSARKVRPAVELYLICGALLLILVGITQWASDGRAIAIFRLCGGGGGGLSLIKSAPAHFYDEAAHFDRAFLGFFLIAAAILVFVRSWTSLPAILLIVTTLGTAAIFASPGTRFNHLVDLTAAAILVIAVFCARDARLGSVAIAAAIAFSLLSSYGCWRQASEIRRYAARAKMEAALADTDRSPIDGPVLSEDPLLPILRGQRPYMLDPFMFRVLRFRDPSITNRMWDELANQRFKAVILHEAPTSDLYTNPADGNLGPGFVDQVQKYYVLAGVHGKFHVFLPRPR